MKADAKAMPVPAIGVRIRTRLSFGAAWLVLRPVSRLSFGLRARARARAGAPTVLAIDSGERGWELAEYQELLASAIEFMGSDRVRRIVVADRHHYLRDVRRALRLTGVTHYFYDPRTGSQHGWAAPWQSFLIGLLLAWKGIVPIARQPDFAYRRWRLQCGIVTAGSGVCMIMMEPGLVRGYFPHRRLVGPMPMPISLGRVRSLALVRRNHPHEPSAEAVFTGSLYEPRTAFLEAVREGLRARGFDLDLRTRRPGESRLPNREMWDQLAQGGVVVTTAFQAQMPGADPIGALHLVYRYAEALAAGALLVGPVVPGSEELFRPGVDYAPAASVDEAVDAAARYLEDHEARATIAGSGMARMAELAEIAYFWRTIDRSLGSRGLAPHTLGGMTAASGAAA